MLKSIGWFGTAVSIAGAFLMSFSYTLPGYVFFMLGTVAWLIVAAVRKTQVC